MKRAILVVALIVGLTGCPVATICPNLILATVRVIATCPDPGAPCTFEHVMDGSDEILSDFTVESTARRESAEDAATDDVTVMFTSSMPVMGYRADMNNVVDGDTQTLTVAHPAGLDTVDVVYNWKMKIALDGQNQYELTMEFLGPEL